MPDRVLLRGGQVLTVDPELGNLRGDVLIEGDTIARVAPSITGATTGSSSNGTSVSRTRRPAARTP